MNSNLIKNINENTEYNSNPLAEKENIIPENSPIHIFCNMKNEINNQNENGWTPIYRCIVSNNLFALTELLKIGANPNIPNIMNETPLYHCVETQNYDALIILLEYKADPNISRRNGTTPLHLATKKKMENFISSLLRHGANPNLKNTLKNETSLHIAVKEKANENILKIFKNFNADYNIKDKYDKSCYNYAEENGEEYKEMFEKVFKIGNNNVDENNTKFNELNNNNKNDNNDINNENYNSNDINKKSSNNKTPKKKY